MTKNLHLIQGRLEMKQFNFGSAKVTVIDKSGHEARKQRLKEPLERFFKEIKKEGAKNEFKNQTTDTQSFQRHQRIGIEL